MSAVSQATDLDVGAFAGNGSKHASILSRQRRVCLGSKGWRSGESARLPPMWPEFKSWRRRHMWVEFVVGSLLCSERFFSGYSRFPLSSKTNISKFQFHQESGRRRTTLWMCYLQIIIIIIIIIINYYYYYYKMIRFVLQAHRKSDFRMTLK